MRDSEKIGAMTIALAALGKDTQPYEVSMAIYDGRIPVYTSTQQDEAQTPSNKFTVVWRDEGEGFFITPIIFEGVADIRRTKDMVIQAARQEYKQFMNEHELEAAMSWITEPNDYEIVAIFHGHVETFFK